MNKNIDITNVTLTVDDITLRPFKESDLNDFYEYAKVEGVGENAGWHHHTSIDESKKILDKFIESKKTFAIVLNNKVIGSIGIEEYDENHFKEGDNLQGRELGFVLSKDYWNKGIMTKTARRVLDYLFNDLELDFVTCGHFVHNISSKRVQEKLGFKYVRTIKYETRMGDVFDAYFNVIYKKDYLNMI